MLMLLLNADGNWLCLATLFWDSAGQTELEAGGPWRLKRLIDGGDRLVPVG